MVNFNYRVGIWGFLASDRLRRNGDLNVGLLDQRMLLRWVKKYIAQASVPPAPEQPRLDSPDGDRALALTDDVAGHPF
jgi:hypothetical protein